MIRTARPYVHADVLRSADYAVTKRILVETSASALDYFLTTIWSAELEASPEMRALAHRIDAIDRQGLLTRVLLTEFLEIGRRNYPMFAPPGLHETTLAFVDHVYRIITKRHDEDLGDALVFTSGALRVGFVLVADRAMADRAGERPYVWRCLQDIKKGCTAVYLLARGSNTTLIEGVLRSVEGNGRVLDVGDMTTYDITTETGPVKVTCARVLGDSRGYHASPETSMQVVAPAS